MKKRIVFTGGGTGGHVFPGLAVAEELLQRGEYDLLWMGSPHGIEYSIVKRWGIPFIGIPAGKLRRYFSLHNIIDIFRVLAGFCASCMHFIRVRPDLVFSKGGYVSVPPVFAARLLKIPVITHDSDLDPGLATRLNARAADIICVPYEQSLRYFPLVSAERLRVTGNPVRREITEGNAERLYTRMDLRRDLPLVFIQGGSQGAGEINQLLFESLSDLLQVCVVCHQTGHGGIERAQGFLADNPQYTGRYYPQPFFTEEYADILAAAALSVTRAGAGSLWELAATCTPAVIIPLRSGTRGDQIRNADLFSQLGIGYVLQVSELNPAGFSGCIQRLLQDTEARSRMEAAAKIFAADKGVKKLADVCEELLCS